MEEIADFIKVQSNRVVAEVNEITISITGHIGWDFDGGQLISFLRNYTGENDKIIFDIFSFGGSAMHALAVYDFIKINGIKADANIFGMCASAASIISSACEKVGIGSNSFMLIHSPYEASTGDESEASQQVKERLIDIYKSKTGLGKRALVKLMDEGDGGAIIGAKEAVRLGFADMVLKEQKSVAARAFEFNTQKPAAFDISNLNNSKMSKSKFNFVQWAKDTFGVSGTQEEIEAALLEIDLSSNNGDTGNNGDNKNGGDKNTGQGVNAKTDEPGNNGDNKNSGGDDALKAILAKLDVVEKTSERVDGLEAKLNTLSENMVRMTETLEGVANNKQEEKKEQQSIFDQNLAAINAKLANIKTMGSGTVVGNKTGNTGQGNAIVNLNTGQQEKKKAGQVVASDTLEQAVWSQIGVDVSAMKSN